MHRSHYNLQAPASSLPWGSRRSKWSMKHVGSLSEKRVKLVDYTHFLLWRQHSDVRTVRSGRTLLSGRGYAQLISLPIHCSTCYLQYVSVSSACRRLVCMSTRSMVWCLILILRRVPECMLTGSIGKYGTLTSLVRRWAEHSLVRWAVFVLTVPFWHLNVDVTVKSGCSQLT